MWLECEGDLLPQFTFKMWNACSSAIMINTPL